MRQRGREGEGGRGWEGERDGWTERPGWETEGQTLRWGGTRWGRETWKPESLVLWRQGVSDTDKIRHRQTDRQTLRKCNTETPRASRREPPPPGVSTLF